jgi:endo-1,3(4)-beta-glucanase
VRAAGRLIAALVALGALATTGCSGGDQSTSSGEDAADALPEGQSALPASVVGPLVEQVPEVALAPLPALRLADGLTPPTNRWFSGLVFGDEPQPVFPLPLAFSIDDTSFGAGLPQIVTSATNIIGSSQQDVSVEVAKAASTVVSAYDVASVTL